MHNNLHRGSTESATLRRLVIGDAPAILAAFLSNPDMARQGDITSLESAEAYVTRLIAPDSVHEAWAIADHDSLVGVVGVSVDQENRNGWFWYWMADGARGRGWVARAAATVADWALSARGLERLELGHRVNNPASGAVALKAGFVHEGTERGKFLVNGTRIDVHTYGRILSDPAPTFDPIAMISA